MLIASFYELYRDNLQLCRTSSSYVYESVKGLGILFHKVDLNRGSSCIPSPDWLKNKKATINPQNTKDNYCFMYVTTIAFNHKEIGPKPERISKRLLEHISKYNWGYIDFPPSIHDYQIFEKLNEDIALNVLYVPYNAKKIMSEYISKHNFARKNQVTLLQITDNKGTWHFLALKSIPTEDGFMRPTKSFSRLMEGISSENHGEYYCYECFHSFRCKSTLRKHEELCKDHKHCKVTLPTKGKKYKHHKFRTKSLRMNDMIYLDLECLLRKYDTCSNDPNKSSTEKIAYHEACGYSICTKRNHTKESTNIIEVKIAFLNYVKNYVI